MNGIENTKRNGVFTPNEHPKKLVTPKAAAPFGKDIFPSTTLIKMPIKIGPNVYPLRLAILKPCQMGINEVAVM